MTDFCPVHCTRNTHCEDCANEEIADLKAALVQKCDTTFLLIAEKNAEIARLKEIAIEWNEGYPKRHYFEDEWFLAKTKHRDFVVLRSLPENYTYDFQTADETYISKHNILKWSLLPHTQWRRDFAPDMTEKETKGE